MTKPNQNYVSIATFQCIQRLCDYALKIYFMVVLPNLVYCFLGMCIQLPLLNAGNI